MKSAAQVFAYAILTAVFIWCIHINQQSLAKINFNKGAEAGVKAGVEAGYEAGMEACKKSGDTLPKGDIRALRLGQSKAVREQPST